MPLGRSHNTRQLQPTTYHGGNVSRTRTKDKKTLEIQSERVAQLIIARLSFGKHSRERGFRLRSPLYEPIPVCSACCDGRHGKKRNHPSTRYWYDFLHQQVSECGWETSLSFVLERHGTPCRHVLAALVEISRTKTSLSDFDSIVLSVMHHQSRRNSAAPGSQVDQAQKDWLSRHTGKNRNAVQLYCHAFKTYATGLTRKHGHAPAVQVVGKQYSATLSLVFFFRFCVPNTLVHRRGTGQILTAYLAARNRKKKKNTYYVETEQILRPEVRNARTRKPGSSQLC